MDLNHLSCFELEYLYMYTKNTKSIYYKILNIPAGPINLIRSCSY